jgi:hypothetical protein
MNMRENFLDILLDLTHNENISVRNNSIRIAKSLHEKEEFKQPIEVNEFFVNLKGKKFN